MTQKPVNLKSGVQLNDPVLTSIPKLYRAINHKLRQNILSVIDSNGRMDVTTLYKILNIEQSVASQHLKVLRDAGFVSTTREGKRIYYSVNDTAIEKLIIFSKSLNK